MDPASPAAAALLRLTLVDGVGPILGRRLVEQFGSPDAAFDASPADLERVRGIGPAKAATITASMRDAQRALDDELALAQRLGARFIALGEPEFPPLLALAPDAPLVLSVLGTAPGPDDFAVAIVGSRHCTAYGIEQAERFGAWLAQSGLVIASGGARGIDTAAHRAAVRVRGRTVAVLGCGLATCYPPENADLFKQIVDAGGALISELPLRTAPAPDNFPARNRIIAAMSLGVLVIEAPKGSGALITARQAVDDYGREVLAIPGRVDSRASEGSNELIQKGEAAVALQPSDVLDALESAARHQHAGTIGPLSARSPESRDTAGARSAQADLPLTALSHQPANDLQRRMLEALNTPMTVEELCRTLGADAGLVQAEATRLELSRTIVRHGSRLARRTAAGPGAIP